MNQTQTSLLLARLNQTFGSQKTLPEAFRVEQLKKLLRAIEAQEQDILAALFKDLHKNAFEAYGAEIGLVKEEIRFALKNLSSWMKPKSVKTPWVFMPGRSQIEMIPKGVVLIIAPWNYPFQLCMLPLVSAIAAGNCALIKPSEFAPHTAQVVLSLVQNALDGDSFCAVLGGAEVSDFLLNESFDHIFFTGGSRIGRLVMEKAAKHLTPVTLELGGKSPALVDETAHLPLAAKRIAFGKWMNAGQTCIAPDYVLIQKNHAQELMKLIREALLKMFGENPQNSPDYGRIINQKHWLRLKNALAFGQIYWGGQMDEADLYLAPTIVTQVPLDSSLMTEEIFGPILPIVPYERLSEAVGIIQRLSRPLAFYIFSRSKPNQDYLLKSIRCGGVCINDTLSHVANVNLPFGGIQESGFGSHHGYFGFLAFSHQRAIYKRSHFLDLSLRYPPYNSTKLSILKKIM